MDNVDYKKSDYHRQRHPEFFENPELFSAWGHFVKLAYFGDQKIVGKRVLEYGGALGYNLQQLKSQADVSMIEPSDIGREIALSQGIQSYSSANEIKGQIFDIVLCRHVLEHISDPLKALQEMNSLLAEGGQLILVLPIEKHNLKLDENDLNHHLYAWNAQTISNLTRLAGFHTDTLRFEYYGMRRKLLPLYRAMGGQCYAKAIRIVGRCLGYRELVLLAHKVKSGK